MIEVAQSVKQDLGTSYRGVCRELVVPYSSLMRWKSRQARGEAVVRHPGPAKEEPLDLETLTSEIIRLAHGRRRTRGTGALYQEHREEISRRDLHALVEKVRWELRREADALQRRVEWMAPGWVWSIDDAQLDQEPDGHGHLHVVHDLGSRYTLKSLGSEALADGQKVAWNLDRLFEQYGSPLFIKRDNGKNLNHHEVNQALGERGVIPINSPKHYPPYNGAIERKQLELQRQWQGSFGMARVDPLVFTLEAELCGHELNHKRRRSLAGQTACRALEDARGVVRHFDRRKRREVYEKIKTLAVDIIEVLDDHTGVAAETAFRYAAETWMQQNNIIRVVQNGEVLPCFHQFWSH